MSAGLSGSRPLFALLGDVIDARGKVRAGSPLHLEGGCRASAASAPAGPKVPAGRRSRGVAGAGRSGTMERPEGERRSRERQQPRPMLFGSGLPLVLCRLAGRLSSGVDLRPAEVGQWRCPASRVRQAHRGRAFVGQVQLMSYTGGPSRCGIRLSLDRGPASVKGRLRRPAARVLTALRAADR